MAQIKHQFPASWPISYFKDVAEVITGTTPSTKHPEYYNGFTPFVGPAELGTTEPITQSFKYLTSLGVEKARLLPPESVLVCCVGTIGKVGFSGTELATNQQINALVFDKSIVYPRYAFYYCQTLEGLIRHMGASTTLPILPKRRFQNLQIPLPPIDEQRRIAAILDQADVIRRKRQQAITLTDELLRSTFLEMFGDPVINPKGWEVKKLEEVALKRKGAIKCGPFGSQLLISEFVKYGIPVYGIDNVQKNKFVWAKPKYITTEKYEQLKSFSIQDEDVLISRTGTVGRTCVAPPNIPKSILGPNLLKVSLNTNKMLPKYFSYALNHSNPLIEEVKRMSPVATVAVFNTTNLKALRVTIPYINLQSQFVNFTENVELTKQKESNYLTESNNLFNSLLQRAFKDQL